MRSLGLLHRRLLCPSHVEAGRRESKSLVPGRKIAVYRLACKQTLVMMCAKEHGSLFPEFRGNALSVLF